jgi:hypothetical protein
LNEELDLTGQAWLDLSGALTLYKLMVPWHGSIPWHG